MKYTHTHTHTNEQFIYTYITHCRSHSSNNQHAHIGTFTPRPYTTSGARLPVGMRAKRTSEYGLKRFWWFDDISCFFLFYYQETCVYQCMIEKYVSYQCMIECMFITVVWKLNSHYYYCYYYYYCFYFNTNIGARQGLWVCTQEGRKPYTSFLSSCTLI